MDPIVFFFLVLLLIIFFIFWLMLLSYVSLINRNSKRIMANQEENTDQVKLLLYELRKLNGHAKRLSFDNIDIETDSDVRP